MHVSSVSRVRSLRWLFLLLLALVAFTTLAAEPREVGRVLVASGEVTATREGASTRALSRGDRLYEGDAITTGTGARVQLRLVDEGLVQLAADTEYRIEHYRTQGEERGAVTELVEGGLRTVTGAIGDDDPEDYQLDTPVATIGIRGTHFALHHSRDRGTVGEVAQGAIVVENDGGAAEIGAGQFFTVRSRQAPPEPMDQRPAALDTGGDSGSGGDEDTGDEDSSESDDEAEGDGEGSLPPEGDEDGADGGLPGSSGDGEDDGFLSRTDEPLYNPAEDEDTRETVEEQANEDDATEDDAVVATPWYEDVELTQAGYSTDFTASPAYSGSGTFSAVLVEDGFVDEGSSFEESIAFSVGEDGTVVVTEMRFPRYMMTEMEDWEEQEVVLASAAGAELADSGHHESLGVHWGRWNLGDYDLTVGGNSVISSEATEMSHPPGTDWHWIMLEDMGDLTTSAQFAALSGTDVVFQWAGGTAVRGGGAETAYGYSVDQFKLVADFENNQFTEGSFRIVPDDQDSWVPVIEAGLVEPTAISDAGFDLEMSGNGAVVLVDGHFLRENADGALVNYEVTGTDLFLLQGVGVLEQQ
jgi:hypothetical protein